MRELSIFYSNNKKTASALVLKAGRFLNSFDRYASLLLVTIPSQSVTISLRL